MSKITTLRLGKVSIRLESIGMLLLWVIGNLLLFAVGYYFNEATNFYFVLSVLGAVQLLLALYIDIRVEKSLINPLVIYDLIMYLFLFGQCLMWLITENYSGRNLIELYHIDYMEAAQAFTLGCMFFFHLALYAAKGRKIKVISQSRTAQRRAAMYLCGKLLFCATLIPEIAYCIRNITLARIYGYMGLYEVETGAIMQLFLTMREFFFPSVVLILCGKANLHTKMRRGLVGLLLIDALVSLYVGSRSDAIMQILSLVLILQVINPVPAKAKKWAILKYGVLFAVLILTANIVRVIRTMPNRGISTFFEYLLSPELSGEDNMLVGLMGELGATMGTLLETMYLVPYSFSHLHGKSYLLALTWLLPSFLSNNAWLAASMNNWIDSVRYTGNGWGFSTTAEAYYNFGMNGVVVFLVIGFVVGKLFKGLDRKLFLSNPVEFALSFILFNRLLIFSRIDFLSTLPSIVYFYFGIKIFIFLMDYINRAKGGRLCPIETKSP